MEFLIGMMSGCVLAVIVSFMGILLSRKAVFIITLGVICPIMAFVLWIIAIPIAHFAYDVPTINVWRSLLFVNVIFFAIGTFIMRKFWPLFVEELKKEQEEKSGETNPPQA